MIRLASLFAAANGTKKLMKRNPYLTGVGVLACFVAGVPQTWAQTFGLDTQYRLVSTDASGEIRKYSGGLQPSLVPLVSSDTNSGSKYGSYTSSSISVSTYYGNMSVTGSGISSNSPLQGSFAFIDTPVGGAPWSMYKDTLHVTSSTLAAGTPVTIGLSESFIANFTQHDPLGTSVVMQL